MRVRSRKKPLSDINVVPYIDVMLVLVVIFMITAPMLSQGVKVNLPQAQTEAVNSKAELPLIVSVNQQGEFFLSGGGEPLSALTAENLAVRIKAELAIAAEQQSKRTVLVKGDKLVSYGKVVEAMALLQQAGVNEVGLLTSPVAAGSAMPKKGVSDA